jgi:uncharacterized phage infection (PIP) family protein YhgE
MTSKIEVDWNNLTADHTEAQVKHERLTKLVNESNERFLNSTEALQKQKVIKSASVSEMLMKLKQAKAQWDTHREKLLSSAKRHEDARLSHGFSPTAPNSLPSLDMQQLASLLDGETQSTGAERAGKLELTTQLATLRNKLASLSDEQCTKKEATVQFTAQVEEKNKTVASLNEDAAQQQHDLKDALAHLEDLKSDHKAKLKKNEANEEAKDDRMREKVSKLEKEIGRARRELADSASTLTDCRAARDAASEETRQSLEEAKGVKQKVSTFLTAMLKNDEDGRDGYEVEEWKQTKAAIDEIKSGKCRTLRHLKNS